MFINFAKITMKENKNLEKKIPGLYFIFISGDYSIPGSRRSQRLLSELTKSPKPGS